MPKPPKKTADNGNSAKRKSSLSKVAGAGTGSGIIVWADTLALSPTWKMIVQAAAPWVAIGISYVGPIVASMCINTARYYGTSFLLKRAKSLHEAIPDTAENAAHRNEVAANIREYEATLTAILHDASHAFKVVSTR